MVNNFIKYVEFKYKATITAKQVIVPKISGFLCVFSRTVRIMSLIPISHIYILVAECKHPIKVLNT